MKPFTDAEYLEQLCKYMERAGFSDGDSIIVNLNDASCTARIQLGDTPKKGFIETVGPFTCQ